MTRANQQLSTKSGSSVNFINLVDLGINAQKPGRNLKLSRALWFLEFTNVDMNRFDTHFDTELHLFV